MADAVALSYRNRKVVFEKCAELVAVRARAGMAAAMQADVDSIASASRSARRLTIGAFEVVELRPSTAGLEQDLDRLRARPSVAAASHVFTVKGQTALMVPDGHVHLQFDRSVSAHQQRAVLTRFRLQVIEERGGGDFLVRITQGSKNPLVTAADLQAEPGVILAEPEFVDAD
ncbi:MAG: hypothetical protein OEU92_27510 [Alphaproteobacteria bacterium]|nr:hypothetical protein [Alphaproteobacteria bacterium]